MLFDRQHVNLSQLVAQVYLKATGKVSTLTSTDAKYLKIRDIANGKIHEWESEPNVDWLSLYEKDHSIGTVSATDTFDLDDDIRKLSDARGDYVQIEDANGNRVSYNVVPADTLKRYDPTSQICAQIGSTLVFPNQFAVDSPLIGGTIYVPAYLNANALTDPTDIVPVDIPQWLVIMTAAEYVRNDITKQNQYPNLVAEANQIMQRMIEDNEGQVSEVFVDYTANGRSW